METAEYIVIDPITYMNILEHILSIELYDYRYDCIKKLMEVTNHE